MEFFAGFQWAVPIAFSDAVSLCRFEEGDVLYDSELAYHHDWEKTSQFVEYSLQVQYPARATGEASEKGGSVFESNWTSAVRVDLYKNFKKINVGQIHTTQGRLYTALWKGNLSVLENEAEDAPIPITLKGTTKMLGQADDKARELSIGFPVFVMARDLSNVISRDKHLKLTAKLNKHMRNAPEVMTPKDAGLVSFENIAPTMEIVFFPVYGTTADELHEIIKSTLYVPTKNTTKEKFRISAHGIII